MDSKYNRTIAGSVGAGISAIFNATERSYYILEHKVDSEFHSRGESQKIIIDQIELGRASSCQVRFGESFETVSRRHAAIVRDADNWKLIPLSKTNATLVNGRPINGEWNLCSGDEIQLSSSGPVLGFIIPQGTKNSVKGIGFTERLNLARKQALAPYKRAMLIISIIVVLAIAGFIAWNIYTAKLFDTELKSRDSKIEQVEESLSESDKLIDALNRELDIAQHKSAAEYAKVQKRLEDAQEEREELISELEKAEAEREALVKETTNLRNQIKKSNSKAAEQQRELEEAQRKIEMLEQQLND